MIRNKKLLGTILVFIITCMICTTIVYAENELKEGYFTVYEENTDKKILCTSRVVNIGDKYLNDQNMMYEVVKVSGDKAYAKFKEKVNIESALEMPKSTEMAETMQSESKTLTAKENKEKLVVLYHTHSDESYIPTDGHSSIPHRGGIYKVGEALKQAFEEKGIKAVQAQESHDPHDAMAYQRSRRTATELLKKNPDAIIDVHRDGVPAEEYETQVNGQPLAKIQLVVGRQNPQMEAVNNFAWQLKANADKKYPGLIKGIFYGKGGYNQDVFPRSILVEAGTYTNSRYWAQDGANILADVVATTLYGEENEKKAAGKTTQIPGEGKGTGKAIMWIVGLAVIGTGAYLLISTGGINELSAKVKRFTSKEFANFLGNTRSKNKVKEEDDNTKDGDEE